MSYIAMTLAQSTAPVEDQGPDPDSVTPGTVGFIVTILVVIVAIFLANDAFRRVRRLRARSQAVEVAPLPIRPDGAHSDWEPGNPKPEAGPRAAAGDEGTESTPPEGEGAAEQG